MTCLLTVKVGNAETQLGCFEGDELLGTWALSTRSISTADEAELALRNFCDLRDLPQSTASIACSVAPLRTEAWTCALRALTGQRALVVGPGLKSGMQLGYKDPGQIGADRVACAVAARALYGAPAIVFDFGTSTTLTVIGTDGALLGGVIAAGMRAALGALKDAAALLPEVPLQVPRTVIGRTTADAMRSGAVFGEAARADGLIEAIWDELGYETALVATGRFSGLICPSCVHAIAIREDLALQGLQLIYDLNQ